MNRNIKNSKKIILSAALQQDRRFVVRCVYLPDCGGDNPPFILPLIYGMAEYPINKGIGRSVEFKGLKAQYLFIFVGGLLALFVLFVILYMVGTDQWICIGIGAAGASVLVWQTFALNARYGEHGKKPSPLPDQPSAHCPAA